MALEDHHTSKFVCRLSKPGTMRLLENQTKLRNKETGNVEVEACQVVGNIKIFDQTKNLKEAESR
jgi:hypothetical protein